MTEITIHGRGGQGGVTLAKLIAATYFLKGRFTQAFGVYAAERSGAPLQAFVRVDSSEITNHNQIREPNHVIVLDRTLIGPNTAVGHQPDGWILLNTPQKPEEFADLFAGRRVACVDATEIAVRSKLGTRTVPIVNTTMLGAVGGTLGLAWPEVEAALNELNFGGANIVAAQEAFEAVQKRELVGEAVVAKPAPAGGPIPDLLDESIGDMPKLRTGNWANRRPHRQRLTSPCSHACPAGNDIQGFVEALGREQPDEALAILLETTPLPGTCGRVCPAPCMDGCNRKLLDEAVQIRDLERYAAEHGRRPDAMQPTREEHVAIIGSGPAGLSAAYHLARLGYRATMFESAHELGGLLRTGIPRYRLPREVLDHEIEYILRHGVTAKTDHFVDRTELLDLSHTYDAVFVAAGLQELRALDLGEKHPDCVSQGIDFLDLARQGKTTCVGQRVAVVGGGNTAVDAARTALRLGAKHVRIVYRRTRAEMPAIREEVDEGLEEHIELDELVMPLRLTPGPMGATLTCTRMKLGEPDESGRRRPVPETSEDAQFDIECDRVLLALGQSADLSILPEGGEVQKNGAFLGLTGAPVFLGGDFATNDGTVSAAIGNGRRAALHIHNTLTGENLFPVQEPAVAEPDVMHMHVFKHAPAEHAPHLPANLRRRNFAEVRLGLTDEPGHEPAVAEAQRCFSCGVCNECDRCLEYCPEGVLLHERDPKTDTYRFDFDYCKGCGVCASQCPRGVIYMAEL